MKDQLITVERELNRFAASFRFDGQSNWADRAKACEKILRKLADAAELLDELWSAAGDAGRADKLAASGIGGNNEFAYRDILATMEQSLRVVCRKIAETEL